eukprot:CAMPEP_0176346794 /NCGR_PEP_ID=MMETSP0126-20121128/6512_1 /TAXON_ID=141414 ORGANISM="Strombidinopsis acuminatum, Strain SPMC142" /NCGR_SAMPLE_ID=MMETSP0126 /ASSEMBLY_ACC=CAM_ASM_000229 /LENGTH=119 /DNA_ID=CAMNT_0017694523 /DNA_START=50 /DNA_END=409 /DNA_ORIENTATION=+
MACMSLSMKCAVAAKPVARKVAAKKTVVSKAVVAKAPVSKKVALSAAVTTLATQALPALAVVDERLNGDGTGLIFGINDESLGFILLTVPVLVFSAFYAAQKDAGIQKGGADDDSGLSL